MVPIRVAQRQKKFKTPTNRIADTGVFLYYVAVSIRNFILTIVRQAVSEIVSKEVTTRIDELESRFETRFDAVDARFTELEKRIDARFTELEKRFETRFDSIETALAKVQGNLEGEARFFHLADYLKKQQSS